MLKQQTKNFCALPFDHVMIKTNGNFDICSIHTMPSDSKININKHDHNHWLQSEHVRSVRECIQMDQRHPGCEQCWRREDKGFDSLRSRTDKEFSILPNRSDRPIKNVEINFGNLCNLRCLMCNEVDSSAILAENKRLGLNSIEQRNVTWTEHAYDNVNKLLAQQPYVVNIRGGEPLYNKRLLDIIENLPMSQSRDTILHITTNATQWSDRWRQALEKFRLVRFMFSIDATGDLYEYIRYPASWPAVEKNIKSMMTMPNSKCLVHCVGQNLNVAHLPSLIDWCMANSLYLQIESLEHPNYMQMHNLPDKTKNFAISQLNDRLEKQLEPHLEKFVIASCGMLQRTPFDQNLWQQFIDYISIRDRSRGNCYSKFIRADPC